METKENKKRTTSKSLTFDVYDNSCVPKTLCCNPCLFQDNQQQQDEFGTGKVRPRHVEWNKTSKQTTKEERNIEKDKNKNCLKRDWTWTREREKMKEGKGREEEKKKKKKKQQQQNKREKEKSKRRILKQRVWPRLGEIRETRISRTESHPSATPGLHGIWGAPKPSNPETTREQGVSWDGS